jgi:hypothetical protein
VILAVAFGIFVADFISGLLHWAFDTWFDERIAPLRRMVLLVREHHLRPARALKYRFRHDAGTLSWFALSPPRRWSVPLCRPPARRIRCATPRPWAP